MSNKIEFDKVINVFKNMSDKTKIEFDKVICVFKYVLNMGV